MRLRSILFLCFPLTLGLAVACERNDVVAVEPAGPAPAAVAAENPAAKRMPLPDCAAVTVGIDSQGQPAHVDCRGMLPGDSGVAYEARYSPAADGLTRIAVQIVGPGDATIQTIDEQMEGTAAVPTVQDIDSDGHPDLLLPLLSGNVNTNWAVWRGRPDGGFSRAGELSGVKIAMSKGGQIATVARSGANVWNVSFYSIEDGQLAPIAIAEASIELIDGGARQKRRCSIVDTSGLGKAGMSPIQAEKVFCMDPLVSEIFS